MLLQSFKRRKEKVADRDGKRVKYCAYHGNSPLTKVAIVTENLENDEKRVKKLSKKPGTDQIRYKVFPIKEEGEPFRAEEVIKRVIDWGSTNVVINIQEDVLPVHLPLLHLHLPYPNIWISGT